MDYTWFQAMNTMAPTHKGEDPMDPNTQYITIIIGYITSKNIWTNRASKAKQSYGLIDSSNARTS